MKKGFFFSMDGFLALILFALFLSLIYSFFISVPRLEQPFYFSEDILDVFSEVKVSELDLNSYPGIQGLMASNAINNTNKTIFEVMVDFKVNNHDIANSRDLVSDLITGIVPEQYGFGIDFGNYSVYEKTKNVTNLVSRQRLVIG